jgi:hypothetical protein
MKKDKPNVIAILLAVIAIALVVGILANLQAVAPGPSAPATNAPVGKVKLQVIEKPEPSETVGMVVLTVRK